MAPDRIGQTPDSASGGHPKTLREARKDHIERTLQETGYDIPETARLLGVTGEMLRCLMEDLKIALPQGKEDLFGSVPDNQTP